MEVDEFKYLGSVVTSDVTVKKDIRSRIAMGKKAFMDKRKLFASSLNLVLRKRIIKCFVWSVALYAAETWTLTKADKKRLGAFDVWIWR